MKRLTDWLYAWWITLRYGSRFTKAGRALLAALADPLTDEFYVEVERPGGDR